MKESLPVVSNETGPPKPTQNCFTCRNKINCWAPKIREEHIMLNLLVCRLKRKIDVERTTKSILELIRPKLKILAKTAHEDTNVDQETALLDMESAAIEYLQQHYLMGEVAYPLHYLFGIPKGVMGHYALNYARKQRNYEDTYLVSNKPVKEEYEPSYDPREEVTESEHTKMAREVMNDGITLNLLEYRVFSFCLANASDSSRPTSGLYAYLAKSLGIPRSRVTKIFTDAGKKVVLKVNKTLGSPE